MKHVWGYAVGLDMTRRDLQGEAKKQGRPWCIGKGFDESAPIGPIAPGGAVPAIGPDTAIALEVNGAPRQSSTHRQADLEHRRDHRAPVARPGRWRPAT